MAAGQDQNQKKNPVVITPQIQDLYAQQKQQLAQQQQQQHQPAKDSTSRSKIQTKPPVVAPQQNSNKSQTVTIRHAMEIQKPSITTTTVQPQTKLVHTSVKTFNMATPMNTLAQGSPNMQQTSEHQLQQEINKHSPLGPRTSGGNQTGPLPQLPPRIPSQTSTENLATSPTLSTGSVGKRRGPPPGPPPAIPPRTGALARSCSTQVAPTGGAATNPGPAKAFVRQISANSTPPQYTPQPPPPFVIPKRHTTLSRASSVATSSLTTLSGGAPYSNTTAAFNSTVTTNLQTSQSLQQKRPSYGSLSMGASQSATPASAGGNSSTSPQAHRRH